MYDLLNETNITRASPGAKARALASTMSRKLDKMWRQFDLNIVQSYLAGAEGKYLDLIGVMLGAPRINGSAASVSAQQKTISFYVDSGTFGDINSGQSLHLPMGTIISTQQYGQGVKYRLPYAVILPSNQDKVSVPGEALTTGSKSNVGAKQLIYHDFINYTDVVNNSLKVTNEAEILSGTETEADVNYRFRLSRRVVSAEAANETAIRMAALTTPGVADVIILPFYRGIGSFDMLVKATTPRAPAGLLDTVLSAVRQVTAHGIVPNVRAPIDIGMSLTASLTFKKAISPSEAQGITKTCISNVTDYINNLDIGEDFIVNEVVERVMGTSDLIKNIGSAGAPLDNLYIHVPSQLQDTKVRSSLLGDYTPAADAKLSVEDKYAGATPILVKVAG